MSNRARIFAVVAMLASLAASASQYPMLDMVAQKVIARYEQSTCEQLWARRGTPKSQQEQDVVSLLQGDPQRRKAFLDEVAAPIANKMFECGLIP